MFAAPPAEPIFQPVSKNYGSGEKLENIFILVKTSQKMSLLAAIALALFGGLDRIRKSEIGTASSRCFINRTFHIGRANPIAVDDCLVFC